MPEKMEKYINNRCGHNNVGDIKIHRYISGGHPVSEWISFFNSRGFMVDSSGSCVSIVARNSDSMVVIAMNPKMINNPKEFILSRGVECEVFMDEVFRQVRNYIEFRLLSAVYDEIPWPSCPRHPRGNANPIITYMRNFYLSLCAYSGMQYVLMDIVYEYAYGHSHKSIELDACIMHAYAKKNICVICQIDEFPRSI